MSQAMQVVILQTLQFLLDQQIKFGDAQASAKARHLREGMDVLVEVEAEGQRTADDLSAHQASLGELFADGTRNNWDGFPLEPGESMPMIVNLASPEASQQDTPTEGEAE